MSANSAPQPSSLPLRCADAVPYLSAYADGELAQPLRGQIAAHLDACESCSAQVARYVQIDAALMTLSRTAPSAAVFDRISAAVATHPSEPAVRESLRERRRAGYRRVVEVQQWGEEDTPQAPAPARHPRLPRWAAAGLPTVAAILLVAFTAVALRGLGVRPPQAHIQPTSSVTGDPIALTQTAIQTAMLGKNMNFTAISPTYVPGAPTLLGVAAHVVADPSGGGALYLDVTWTLSGSMKQVHLREGPTGSEWNGYTPTSATGLTWQVGANQWAPLAPRDGSGHPAVGEKRGNMWLAMDATPANGSATAQALALSTLRVMSLSMDSTYLPLPVQQIIPVHSNGNVMYHLTGSLVGSPGTVDAYYEPAQSASHVDVQTPSSHFTDIISGQQGVRLDLDHDTYQQMPPPSLTPGTLDQSGLQVFYQADTDARSGLLWYVGPAKYNGNAAYKFLLVDAPHVTQVYVDANSKQVVAVTVDLASSEQPGGANAPSRFTNDACINYKMVEYTQPDPRISFSPTPPAGFSRGAVPSGIACASNTGVTTSQ